MNVEFHEGDGLGEEGTGVGWNGDGRHGARIFIREFNVDIELGHDNTEGRWWMVLGGVVKDRGEV